MNETLKVGGLTFEIRRSPRRKTLALAVERSGELAVYSPAAVDMQELARWTRGKLLWVHRKLAIKAELAGRVREPEFVSGESFSYLGRTYLLKVVRGQAEPLRFDGRNFLLSEHARSEATDRFRRWYIDTGRKWLVERVALLSRRAGAKPAQVHVRDLGYRWGSCGRNGVVYFNWRALQLPVRLIDYVVVHELAHLVEASHGRAFWQILDRALPQWRDRQEQLKFKAGELFWCVPQ